MIIMQIKCLIKIRVIIFFRPKRKVRMHISITMKNKNAVFPPVLVCEKQNVHINVSFLFFSSLWTRGDGKRLALQLFLGLVYIYTKVVLPKVSHIDFTIVCFIKKRVVKRREA